MVIFLISKHKHKHNIYIYRKDVHAIASKESFFWVFHNIHIYRKDVHVIASKESLLSIQVIFKIWNNFPSVHLHLPLSRFIEAAHIE